MIPQIKPLGQVVVYLDGTELPFAPEGIFDHEIQFWSVECRFALDFDRFEAHFNSCFTNGLLGGIPLGIVAHVLLLVGCIPQRYLRFELFEAQRRENQESQIDDILEFLLDLVGTAENVCIILRESTDTGQT